MTIPDQRVKDRDGRIVPSWLDDADWRPADHVFTDEEIRDRMMRYGGVDAATAWQIVEFVRDRRCDLDWQSILATSLLTHRVDE